MSKSSRMPVPSAVISVPISWLDSILSKRARSTLRILPRSGRPARRPRARALPRAGGGDDLGDNGLRFLRMLLEPRFERIADNGLHHRTNFRRDEFVLGLA